MGVTAHTRCQICGRRKHLKKGGVIAHHHVKGVPCPGTGHPPIGEDDAFLAAEAERHRADQRRHSATIRALTEARVNYIDPAIGAARDRAWAAADRLERRLKRHRDWPGRFEREMEKYGWGSPPPQYLLDRQR